MDLAAWKNEIPLMREHLAKFGNKLPKGIQEEVDGLEKRL